MSRSWIYLPLLLGLSAVASAQTGLDQSGKPDIKSAGPLAFGPKGVLFVGDTQGAQIFAIGVGTTSGAPITDGLQVDDIKGKVAALLGTMADEVAINDVAVEPGTGIAYLSVSRGRGPSAEPAIVRVDGKGALSVLSIDNVKYAKIAIANAPSGDSPAKGGKASPRQQSITDLGYIDGKLFIAGLSNEEFASKLRSVEFPFKAADTGASVEIWHTAHSAFETRSPVKTFVPFNVGGEPTLLAAYTCTPLVAFPVSSLQAKPGQKVMGKTVAELGNRNNPLDMIAYEKDGKQYLLLANDNRGVMKISVSNIDKQQALTEPVRGGGAAGLPYETLKDLEGVRQLDKVGDKYAVVLLDKNGAQSLKSIGLP